MLGSLLNALEVTNQLDFYNNPTKQMLHGFPFYRTYNIGKKTEAQKLFAQ